MKNLPDYKTANKTLWNEKTSWHIDSDFYAMEAFLNGKNSLNEPELELLGDVKGLSILHLQCHFGQDSISLNRMGATVTGVDLSDVAIEEGRKIALKLNSDTRFICCDIYDLPDHLDQEFDIVFTSYGTIGWLPDMDKWAGIVRKYVKPGGRFIFADFHPVVWMYDNDFEKVFYNYFKSDPIIEKQTGTYADRSAPIETTSISWNHALSEVIGSLLQQGLQLRSFKEYDYSPYNCFSNTVEFEAGKFRIKTMEGLIPIMYTLDMIKPL